MKTATIEIEIPDGHEVEEVSIVWPGYEFSLGVAVGQMVVKTKPDKPFLINGRPADWPEWLTADYVAKDKNGNVFGYVGGQPHQKIDQWESQGISQMLSEFTFIDIPGDWTQSKRENPNRKK
jgi:hypothetical protein